MGYTTIQISTSTRMKLSKMKKPKESYDELITVLMDLVPSGDDEGKYTDEFRMSLVRGLSDIKRGRVKTLDEVKKGLGLA